MLSKHKIINMQIIINNENTKKKVVKLETYLRSLIFATSNPRTLELKFVTKNKLFFKFN